MKASIRNSFLHYILVDSAISCVFPVISSVLWFLMEILTYFKERYDLLNADNKITLLILE